VLGSGDEAYPLSQRVSSEKIFRKKFGIEPTFAAEKLMDHSAARFLEGNKCAKR